ncbi:glycosyltransferase [soil metagenome]
MRLVHLTSSTFFGGPERQMLGLATHLPASVSTTFLSFREGGRCEAFLSEVLTHGFNAHALEQDTPHLRSAIRELTQRLHSLQADVVLCHGYKANLLGRIAARKVGCPAIAVSRGWTGEDRKVRLYERLDRWHLKRMDHVIAVSEGQATKVRACNAPADKLSVIRNAARLDAFEQINPASRLKLMSLSPRPFDRIVVGAGRLSPEKGFDVLVEAAAKTPANIGFILFGEGAERPKLEAMIASHRLADRFILAGVTTELDSLLPGADVVVLPSHTEGLPNVALEASAAGVPVIATAVGGTPEVVVDGITGYLVDDGDAATMALGIKTLCLDDALCKQLGHAGRERMHREFTFDAQARQYLELFDRIRVAKKRAA